MMLNHDDDDWDRKWPERDVKYTFWLFFSVFVCVFGNSFLYGYNIGVVNSPAEIIKVFYAKVQLSRNGNETIYRRIDGDDRLYYVNVRENAVDNQTVVDVVLLGNSTVRPPTTTVLSATGNVTGNNTGAADNKTAVDPNLAVVDDNLLDLLWSITVAIFVLFGMIGAFMSGMVADRIGRKLGMILITVIMFLAAILGGIPTVAKSPECLIISRALVGLHCGISISLASLYLAEISPKKIRGAIGTCHQLFITVGILWSMIMGLPEITGTWNLWPVCFAFNAVPALTCLVLFPLCPESPRFLLIKKNDEDGAKKALQKLRGYHDVEDEIEEMRVEARKASSVKTFTLKQLLTTPDLKLPIIIAIVCQVAQQWSGINAVMSYSVFIFKQANVPEDSIPYVIVVQGAINVLATIVAVPLMEKAGRRPLLLFPMCGMVVSFIVLTICLNLLNNPDFADSKQTLAIICIIVMMTYVIGFALGLGPIPFIVVSEIFRQEPRAAAMSFSLAFNWICNFILMLTFRFIQKGIEEYAYVIFVVILIASIVFIFFFVPETKNRSFDDIAASIAFGRQGKKPAFGENGEEMQPMGAKA